MNKRKTRHLTQLHVLVIGEHENYVRSDVLPFLLYPSSEPWRSDSGAEEAPQQLGAQDGQNQSPARGLHCVGSDVTEPTRRLSLLVSAGLGSQRESEGGRERERLTD